MRKNLWLLGVLLCIFASCTPAESGNPPKDVWSDITSWEQVDGAWVGTQSKTMPLKDLVGAFGMDPDDPSIKDLIRGINVTIAVKATIIIDAGEEVMESSATTTATFSGGNTAILWMFLQELSPEDLPPNVSIDNNRHSVTMDMDEPPTPITLEEIADQFQINQTGTKLKTELDTLEFGEWGALIPSEVILEKQ